MNYSCALSGTAKSKFLSLAFVASALISSPVSATLMFNFSDNGGTTTLVTASGSADLTGGTPAAGARLRLVGWDDLAPAGDNSTSLVADSDFFTFNVPNIGGGHHTFSAIGVPTLTVGGVSIRGDNQALRLDGSGAAFPFFALDFVADLPQTGVVSAIGNVVIDIDFAILPYASGTSIDLQGNGDVVFQFGTVSSVPEPGIVPLFIASLALFPVLRRLRQNA